ncbi:MAG TPA: hypothetical protein VGI19_03130 [Candidatus Cybelea sp.]|jgi:hypothetical protein
MTERERLNAFIARFSPEIAKLARSALAFMRKRLPGTYELVYDNAYALVVGFGPSERPSQGLFSLVIYPRKVSLCFLYGATLPDPERRLLGGGKQVRHIRLADAKTLNERGARELIDVAIDEAGDPFASAPRGRVIVRAVSSRQRPRRPLNQS